jgi:AcrR family transcriptional regulator
VEATLNRRERLRAATLDEINQSARKLLVQDGHTGVSLRAIAREMGMTAPALYRYFPSLEDLLGGLCASLYDELRESLERVRDACPADDPGGRLIEVCREFRGWSVAHPAEFGLMFGSPVPGLTRQAGPTECTDSEPHLAGMRFAALFMALFAEIWSRAPFPVPPKEEIEPPLYSQLEAFLSGLDTGLPVSMGQVFLSCWIRLYGMVALEVFGHLHFALTDPEPMFEAELAALGKQLGIEPRPR